MNTEIVILKLARLKHGPSKNIRLVEDENNMGSVGVGYYKDGALCWEESATDLLLWYVGQQLSNEGV